MMLEKAMKRGRRQCNVEIYPRIAARGVDLFYIGESADNAFGERKSDREIFEIKRGRHHHGMSDAVVMDREWDFFGDVEAALVKAMVLAEVMNGGDGAPRRGVLKIFVRKSHAQRSGIAEQSHVTN